VRIIPSAGPYYVASYTPGQGVVLARNPNYHGSRPRQFARIELAVGISAQRAVSEIEAGSADYTVLGLDSSPSTTTIAGVASQLAARFGPGSAAAAHGRQRYFVNPILQLDAFFLNTRRPLFSDVRLRQAVNYAIDRRALAALGSAFQPLPERPTDHYLPPGIPGFHEADIYPVAPHLAKARQLVRLAHAGGATAVLYTHDAPPGPEQAQIVKNDLAAIGIQVQIKTFPGATLFSRPQRRAVGRLWQHLQPRLLLRADRLPDLRDLRYGSRRALRQAHAEVSRNGAGLWIPSLASAIGQARSTVVSRLLGP
jgi:peptide/nickel transport system substrate-binding protein